MPAKPDAGARATDPDEKALDVEAIRKRAERRLRVCDSVDYEYVHLTDSIALCDEVTRLREEQRVDDEQIDHLRRDLDAARRDLETQRRERDEMAARAYDENGEWWDERYEKLAAKFEAARRELEELRAERLDGLKRANALTLDTQTVGEAVQSLVDMVRKARAERDAAQARSLSVDDLAEIEDCLDDLRVEFQRSTRYARVHAVAKAALEKAREAGGGT